VKLRSQGRSLGCLWAICVPMGLIISTVSTRADTPLYGSPIPLLFGLLVGGMPLLLTFSRRFAVARVDDQGLTLRSGKLFRWSDLRGIQKVQITRNGRPLRVDYAIGFRTGGVSIRAHEYEDTVALWRYLEHVEAHFPRAT
jgi:hypothetical protein